MIKISMAEPKITFKGYLFNCPVNEEHYTYLKYKH